MKIDPSKFKITPIHMARTWQRCSYDYEGVPLMINNTYFPNNPFKPIHETFIMEVLDEPDAMKKLALKYNGKADQDPYGELFYICFDSFEKACAFLESEDYDRMVKEKLPA